MLGRLLADFETQKRGEKIYIIIDKYDNFTKGIIKRNAEKFIVIYAREKLELLEEIQKYNKLI